MAIVLDRGNPQSQVEQHIFRPGEDDDKPYQGAVPMTVGTAYPKQRSVLVVATAAGNVTCTLVDGSQFTFPVPVGLTTIPGSVTKINSTTATATFYNMK